MLNHIVQFSLRYRGVVIALGCLLVGYGVFIAAHAQLDVFPEFAPPQVVIQTEAPGLPPEAVETLVTRPIETSLNGAPALETLRSQSIQGLSAITAVFQENADVYRVRQMVGERLSEVAGHLPQGVKAPKMGPLASSTSLMLAIGLVSDQRTPMELRTFADWTLRPHLLGVPGVAKVEVFGGEVRQLQVQVSPDRLVAYGLSLEDVLAAARKATAVIGAGFIENANQRIVVRTEGQSLTAEALGEVVLTPAGSSSIRLKDVARVVDAPEPKVGDAQVMGQPGIILLASSQYGANTMEVTRALERALAELQPAFSSEGIRLYPRLFRPANFIESSLRNVRSSLLLGGLLVAAVLFLFLLDLRTALISFLSIPVSLLAAVIVLQRWGVSLNTLTLGGFAIAVGVVVDDAIIDVENILRRLRENLSSAAPRSLFQVVLGASLEVRSAVVYATFMVALVFLPVLAMSGVQGRLFAPLASAFILATLASLAVALTLTPALCYVLLSRARPHSEPRYIAWLKLQHRRLLGFLSQGPKLTIACAAMLFAAAVAVLPFFGGEFLPELREGHYVLHLAAIPGTSLPETMRIGRLATLELLKNPHIWSVSQQAGRAENGEDTWGTHYSELHVDLNPMSGADSEEVTGEIRAALSKFPGLSFRVLPFLVERMEETISGATAQVVVNLFGEDLDVLDQKSEEVRQLLSKIKGATDVQSEVQPGVPELAVHLRPERLVQFGFRPVEVLEAVQTACQGTEVGQIYQANRVCDIAVILDEACRKDPEQLGSLLLQNSQGLRLPLRELADLESTTGRYGIMHEGAQRRQQVTCNVEGRDVASFLAELQQQVRRRISFPAGMYPAYGGSAQAQATAKRELLLHSIIAGAGIILLLGIVFRNWRNLLLVLANLPFALIGGVFAIFLSGGWLTVGSLVGLITLFGISTRNSIMLISHFEHLVSVERAPWSLDAAMRGASERLIPILMTALVTGLGLLPMALGSGEAGREIEGPMAVVILGGLFTSTALNLLVLPTMAWRFGRFGAAHAPE